MLSKRIILPLLLLLFLAGGFIAWNILRVPESAFLVMQEEEAVETLLLSGRVVGEGAVPLSFRSPGQIVEIAVEEGDVVFSGDLLARLDDRQAQNALAQGENQLESAQTALSRLQNRELPQAREQLSQAEARAEIAANLYRGYELEYVEPARLELAAALEDEQDWRGFYEEQEELYREGLIEADRLEEALAAWDDAGERLARAAEEESKTLRQLENLNREYEIALSQERAARSALESLQNEEIRQARINVEQAEAQLEQARIDLEQTALKAPFGGVVSRTPARAGQYAAAGQEVLTIIPASGRTYIELAADEEYAGRVIAGQEALITSNAFPERIFRGLVDRVSPTIDPARGTFQVRLLLEQYEAELLPDLAVTAEVVINRIENSLIIEQGFTFADNDRIYVFLYNNGRVAVRYIETKNLGGNLLLVQSGLLPGERVLTGPGLEDGMRIRLGERVFLR